MNDRMPRFCLAKQVDIVQGGNVKNVFDTNAPNRPGPNYDESGNIIPTSIVGKAEWFLKVQEQKRVESCKLEYRHETKEDEPKRRVNPFFSSLKPTDHKQSIVIVEPNVVQKNVLVGEIFGVKKRQEENKEKRLELLKKLKMDARNYITREERVIERFDTQSQRWQERSISLSAKTGRNPDDTLMNRSQQYRKRVEDVEAIALVQSDIERLAQRHWYLGLRQYPHPTNKKKVVHKTQTQINPARLTSRHIQDEENERMEQTSQLSDIFNQFNTRITYNPNKQVEVVRNQTRQNTSLYSKHFLTTFEWKKQELKDQINQKKAQCDDSLILEGQNILDKELQSIMQDNGDDTYIKYDTHQGDNTPLNLSNWDRRELGRTGHQFYPRILKKFE